MARPTWRGAISFGMVSVPVQLYTAVRPRDVRFRQIHRDTGHPVKQKRVDAETGEEVAYDDIVKGYEVADGRYVLVEPDELDELDPKASRSIEIHDFVEQAEIDPIHYDRAYHLLPDGENALKPYTLLAEAMERTDKVAVAQFVMRNHEYLAAVRAVDGRLVLSTMHYSDEVLDAADIEPGPLRDEVEVRDREIEMAEQLIASMTAEFTPEAYRNEHRDRVMAYLEAKGAGAEVEIPEEGKETAEVIDLVAALERSLERASAGRPAGAETAPTGATSGGAESTPYAEQTRAQLYEEAQRRDLPGRSSMSKTELAAALEASDAKTGAA